jgi:RimJ/RimL family protein N-acetyltransferase
MYTFENIAFRSIERSDLEILRKLHNDETTFLNLATIDFIGETEQVSWWERLGHNKNDLRYVICLRENPAEIIGRLRIQNINRQNQNCEIGLDIIQSYRGKGFGMKSYNMVLKFLFQHFNMNMVYLKVADFNPEAKKLYEKVGFEATGYFKDFYYRHGKYWNYILMCLTRERYNTLNSNFK